LKFKLKLNLRPTVSRPVCLVVRSPSGNRDQISFSLKFPLDSCRFCYFVVPSLTRGRTLHFLLGLARAITHWLESRRPHNYILLSHLRLPQPGGPGTRIYIPQEQGGPVIPPDTGFQFVASYDSQGCGGGILTRLHTGLTRVGVEVTLRPTVGQSVLVSGRHPGPATNFSFSLRFSLDSCGFVIL
jgi:hypothetical protein